MTDEDIEQFYEEECKWRDLPNRGLSLPVEEEPEPEHDAYDWLEQCDYHDRWRYGEQE